MYCRLAVLMAEKDPRLNQKRLSEETGLAESTISRLYNNTFTRVDKTTVDVLCRYFGRDINELFELRELKNA